MVVEQPYQQPKMVTFITKVAGVTFEGRQAYLKQIDVSDPVKIEPEPDNKYDANALKVLVAHNGQIWHVGYIPRDLAATIAPHIEGESFMATIREIVGDFDTGDGDRASLGLRLTIEVPNPHYVER